MLTRAWVGPERLRGPPCVRRLLNGLNLPDTGTQRSAKREYELEGDHARGFRELKRFEPSVDGALLVRVGGDDPSLLSAQEHWQASEASMRVSPRMQRVQSGSACAAIEHARLSRSSSSSRWTKSALSPINNSDLTLTETAIKRWYMRVRRERTTGTKFEI